MLSAVLLRYKEGRGMFVFDISAVVLFAWWAAIAIALELLFYFFLF